MRSMKTTSMIALMGLSVLALAASDAFALTLSSGSFRTKGVSCTGTGNVQGGTVSGNCTVADDPNTEVIIICRNPGGNISTGKAFIPTVNFPATQGPVEGGDIDKKGKASFTAVTNADGINLNFDGAQCAGNPACAALQQFCPNPNWVPVDVVPIKFIGVLTLYYCDNDNIHTCTCDPTLDETGNVNTATSGPVNRCATATSAKTSTNTWSFVWSDVAVPFGVIDHSDIVPAAAPISYSCTLPNPDNFVFGSSVPYDCVKQ
ncbi:MAG: hypothetical protein AAB433_00550 [Nitrospirota bacterium]